MVGHGWLEEEEAVSTEQNSGSGQHAGERTSKQIVELGRPNTGYATNHHRTYTEDVPRLYPKPPRRRSNTASQNFSTPWYYRPPQVEPDSRRPNSVNFHARNESAGNFTKSLKTKASRMLRRQGSSSNLTSLKPIDWSQELDETPWETSPTSPKKGPRKLRKTSFSGDTEDFPLRPHISLPFDFRHLTHTNDEDVKHMKDFPVKPSESEFSTLRDSTHASGELRGINAEAIPLNETALDRSPPTSSPTTRPTTPRRPSDHRASPKIPPRPENPWGVEPSHPTDRISHSNSPSLKVNSPSTKPIQPSSHWPLEVRVPESLTPPQSPPCSTDPSPEPEFKVPHAVTSPDETAHALRPPPFEGTILSRVLEEDELPDRRSSVSTVRRASSTIDPTLRHTKSFPSSTQMGGHSRKSSAESYRQSIQLSPKQQRRSIKVVESPFDDWTADIPDQARPASATVKDVEGDWDDVIDWCYDHRAEADCNFDFTRAASPSGEETTPESSGKPNPAQPIASCVSPPKEARRTSSVYSASPPLLPQLQTTVVPDLQPPSAISTQSSFDTDVKTPSDGAPSRFPSFSTKPHTITQINTQHPFHVSNDLTSPGLYEKLSQLNYARESWSYGRADGSSISNSTSNRSSAAPISKSSSIESFPTRSTRRSKNNSQGSLPELLPSRLSREPAGPVIAESTERLSTLAIEDPRQKSPTCLVKDVAQKKLLSRLQSGELIEDACSAQVPLPLHPALRNDPPPASPTSDSLQQNLAVVDKAAHRTTIAPSSPTRDAAFAEFAPAANRLRSASSATRLGKGQQQPRYSRASEGAVLTGGRSLSYTLPH